MTDYLHALPSGYRIEEYELVRVLGSCGFGITYLGYDHHLDKAVAIKEYLPNDLAVGGDDCDFVGGRGGHSSWCVSAIHFHGRIQNIGHRGEWDFCGAPALYLPGRLHPRRDLSCP